MRQPTTSQWDAYTSRAKKQNICTMFHLAGYCGRGTANCRNDHAPLSPAALYTLEFILLECPCRFNGACRRADCYNGHICRDRKCVKGKTGKCKFTAEAHGIDIRVAKWVGPIENKAKAESGSKASSSKDTTGRITDTIPATATGSKLPNAEQIVTNGASKKSEKKTMENWPSNLGVLIDL
jgi:hypothetical protein